MVTAEGSLQGDCLQLLQEVSYATENACTQPDACGQHGSEPSAGPGICRRRGRSVHHPPPTVFAGDSAEVTTSTLAFDNYGYPYLASSGDATTNHSTTPADAPDGSWSYASFGGTYTLSLRSNFTQDLSGRTFDYPVHSAVDGLSGVTFNSDAQISANTQNCTFNGSTIITSSASGQPVTLTGCTLTKGLTCKTDCKLTNCQVSGQSGIGCNDANLEIDGGVYNTHITFGDPTDSSTSDKILTINGGEFKDAVVANHGSVTIHDGDFAFLVAVGSSSLTFNNGTCAVINCTNPVEINGGAITGSIATVGATVTINDGTITGTLTAENGGKFVFKGGSYSGSLDNVDTSSTTGGVFLEDPKTETAAVKVTVPEGVTINGMSSSSGDTTAYVVNGETEQKLTVSYTVPAGRTFHAWMSSSSVDGSSALTSTDSTYTATVSSSTVLTPVLDMEASDLTVPGKQELTAADITVMDIPAVVTGIHYYKDGDAAGTAYDTLPEEPGTYAVYAVLEPAAAENSIAFYAAENDTSRVARADSGIGYYIPTELNTGATRTVAGSTDPVETYTLTVKDGEAYYDSAFGQKIEEAIPAGTTVYLKYTGETSAFTGWKAALGDETKTLTFDNPQALDTFFVMPACNVTVSATGVDPVTPDPPSDSAGSGVGIALAVGGAVLGTAAVGTVAYYAGTTAYLKSVLPEGTSIPTTRTQLAQLLWNEAGKPAPAAVLPADCTDADKALTWCVEQKLLAENANPDSHVTRVQVIQAWNAAQDLQKTR